MNGFAERSFGCILLAGVSLSVSGAQFDPAKLPPAANKQIDFTQDIKPILEQSCLKCHGPEKPKSRFRLDNRAAALKGGENNKADIVPGDSARSLLLYYVAGLDEEMKMPPPGKGQPLSLEQLRLLRAWIDQGVLWETNPPPPKVQVAMAPIGGWIGVSGNKQVFREQSWVTDGPNGGVEHFQLEERLDEKSRAAWEGHALRDDYKVTLSVERDELGFIHFGGQQYRKYFSDSGGYYPLLTPPISSLGRDLHTDIGGAWVDLGLTLPNWPRMTLGYEYQFKRGDKSILQWGAFPTTNDTRLILPAAKHIDEHAHIVKFDLQHEIAGWGIEDTFRGEFFQSDTRRGNVAYDVNNGTFSARDIREGYRHFLGANTFRVEKQETDWLFASAGYLYSNLSGDASFNLDEVAIAPVPATVTQRWRTPDIILERESHVANANALFGPWDGFTISTGVQSEWTRQKGFGEGSLESFLDGSSLGLLTVATHSDLDKAAVEERIDLRYTGIPFTALFAGGRLQQESISQYEDQITTPSPLNDFVRDSQATSDLKEFRAGFNTSPWRWVSLNAHYRYSEKKNHYNNLIDTTPVTGYSAFIRGLERNTDEVDTKLVLHPLSWLQTTLGFRWVDTEYRTATDPAQGQDPITGDLVEITPGGRLLAGTYEAYIYSLNFGVTPFQRLFLSTTFTFQDSGTATLTNDVSILAPYKGHVYSVISSGTFAWTEKTDLRVSYAFSHADYGQNNVANGLPLGIVYQRHWIQAGISRRFTRQVTGKIQYGFSLYDEPSSGGFNNYTAHLIFASMDLAF